MHVESPTFINECQGDMDVVPRESGPDTGEFQAWQIDEDGNSPPWHLLQEGVRCEVPALARWADYEESSLEESPSIMTVRLMSRAF